MVSGWSWHLLSFILRKQEINFNFTQKLVPKQTRNITSCWCLVACLSGRLVVLLAKLEWLVTQQWVARCMICGNLISCCPHSHGITVLLSNPIPTLLPLTLSLFLRDYCDFCPHYRSFRGISIVPIPRFYFHQLAEFQYMAVMYF